MCGPGANVEAVTYRVWMLRALQRTRPELFAGWRQGKDLHPSVFSVAARIKMTGMEIGKTVKRTITCPLILTNLFGNYREISFEVTRTPDRPDVRLG
jgi:hypothetical protein